MAATSLEIEELNGTRTESPHPSSSPFNPRCSAKRIKQTILLELRKQRGITLPLIPMNSTWVTKVAITTAFLGRLGELELAAGTLGFTFANVTGFSVLTGLCWAMEPICGQAHGAKNQQLLHKTLLMGIILLLVTTLPISFLWMYMDRILLLFGQQRDITALAKRYVLYLLPDLVVTSFLCPFKAYLSSQGKTLPIMISSAAALALHVPFNILLSKAKGIEGVALAFALTDLSAAIMLASYMLVTEKLITEGWCEQKASDWIHLLSLSLQCCIAGCLEWWCYEILVLLAGRMHNAKQAVSVLTVVLNFDYVMYAVMSSMATCASTRVSNELGAGSSTMARNAAYVSLILSIVTGCGGGLAMAALRGRWGHLFSHDEGVVDGVGKMLLLMALFEVFNIPLGVCGGIVRGTSRPWLGMCSAGGFYLVGLPLAVALTFKVELGLKGLLLGFLAGSVLSAGLLCVLVAQIDWDGEAEKAQKLASVKLEAGGEDPCSEFKS